MSDEDFEPFVGGPPPDPSERTWRHPSEVAAQASADGATAGDPARLSRALGFLLAGSLGAAACLTVVAVMQTRTNPADPEAAAGAARGVEPFDVAGSGSAEAASTAETTIAITTSSAATEPVVTNIASTTAPPAIVMQTASEHVVPVLVGGEVVASGVMFDGYLLTSARAIGNQLSVTTSDGTEATASYLIGVDPFSDLAVYRPATQARTTAAFESISTNAAVDEPTWFAARTDTRSGAESGEPVAVVAFSADELVVAVGTVIGTDVRALTPEGQPLVGLIDTTVRRPEHAAGSMLLTNDGQPIGIVVDSSSSLASAVPIDAALQIADRLADQGWANATWIGFVGMDHERGVEVIDVTVGGPADDGGLLPGDIIAFFDAAPIEDMGGITAGLRRTEPGDVAILVVERDGAYVAIRVTATPYDAVPTTEPISEPIGG